MRKKIFAMLLSLVLLGSVSAPALAAAEETLDSRLTSVTLAVKETLGIGDEYTQFNGDYWTRGAMRYWNLNWSNDAQSLSVTADDGGKVLSYSRYLRNERYDYNNDFAPAFPAVTRAEAEKSAQAFLKRVLGAGESVTFAAQSTSPAETDSYNFYGVLQISGLDTSIHVSVSVRAADVSVTNFSRDDIYTAYVGTVPSTTTDIKADAAGAQLREKLGLELRFVVSESKDGWSKAVLRYVPVYNGNYVIDAKSGELINVDALYDGLGQNRDIGGYGSAMQEAATADSSGKTTLSDAEQEGIKKLSGVLGETQLDAAVREIGILGVTSAYTRSSVNYSVNQDTGEVTATLSYWLKVDQAGQAGISDAQLKALQTEGNDPYIRKYVTVDAKTAQLQALATYYSGFGTEFANGEEAAADLPAAAASFLLKWHGNEYGQTALYSAVRSTDGAVVRDHYMFGQTVNGYFFPDNQINVTYNRNSGTIDELSVSWTNKVSFGDSIGVVSREEALAAYGDAYKAELSYQNLPVAIDPGNPDHIPYLDMGYSFVYRMALVYTLQSELPVIGIDANTGGVITQAPESENTITYSDTAGVYAESKIQELAQYGVGYYGGAFRPYEALTQQDMLLLLVSAQGYRIDPSELDEDYLYSIAYNLGILDSSERSPQAFVSRAGMVKTLVKMSGYGSAAELPGIYICGFADDQSIPQAFYGYVAIGKGLGIVSGYADNTFRPDRTVSRAEAAVMLYNFMDRNR